MANEIITTFQLDVSQYTQAINAAIGSMQTYDKAAEEAAKDTANLSGESGSAAKKVRELSTASDQTAQRLAKVGDAAKDLGTELKETAKSSLDVTQGFGRVGQAAVQLGRVAIAALGPIGIAISAVAAALVGLAKIFFDTERGSETLDRALSVVRTVLDRILGLAQQLTFTLVDTFKNPQQAVKDLWEAIKVNIANRLQGLVDQFKFLAEVISGVFTLDTTRIEAGVKGFAESTVQAFTGIDDAAGKVTRGFQAIGGEIRKAAQDGLRIEKLKEQLEDLALVQAKREGELNRTIAEQLDIARDVNRTAMERKEAAEAAIRANDELAGLALKQNKLEVERLELQQAQSDTSIEGQIELAKLRARGDQIEADRLNANRRAQAIVRGIDKANADAAIANAQRVAEQRKKADEEATKAAQAEAERRAQIEQAASEQLLKIRQERELAGLSEIERRELIVREAARKELELTRKLFNDLESITAEADIPAVRAQQAEAILGIEQDLAERLANIRKTETESVVTDSQEATAAIEEEANRRVAFIEQASQSLNGVIAAAATGQEDIAKQSAQALLEIAFKALEAQVPILAAQILGQSLATPQSAATGGAAGLAQAAVLTAILRAALGAVRAGISGAFHEGGLVGRDGGTKMHGGRDGWLARVERGEYVMPTDRTARYMPYLEAMRDGTFERMMALRMPMVSSTTKMPEFNDRGIVGAIGSSAIQERKQTELLAVIAKGLRRGVNKRYYA